MTDRAWPPEENCYCGGPEEIYPHRQGFGAYCHRDVPHSPAEPVSPVSAATEVSGGVNEPEGTRE